MTVEETQELNSKSEEDKKKEDEEMKEDEEDSDKEEDSADPKSKSEKEGNSDKEEDSADPKSEKEGNSEKNEDKKANGHAEESKTAGEAKKRKRSSEPTILQQAAINSVMEHTLLSLKASSKKKGKRIANSARKITRKLTEDHLQRLVQHAKTSRLLRGKETLEKRDIEWALHVECGEPFACEDAEKQKQKRRKLFFMKASEAKPVEVN